jgi:hypothetical protein
MTRMGTAAIDFACKEVVLWFSLLPEGGRGITAYPVCPSIEFYLKRG